MFRLQIAIGIALPKLQGIRVKPADFMLGMNPAYLDCNDGKTSFGAQRKIRAAERQKI